MNARRLSTKEVDVRDRFLSLLAVMAFAIAGAWLMPKPLLAQRAGAPRPAASRAQLPRTPDGHPDLQGMYDVAWMTPLERPSGAKLVFTSEEASRLERQAADRRERAALPSRGDREAPPLGGDGSVGAAGNVGGYNNFWIDSGSAFFAINGEKPTAIIVDPPDGRVPQLTAAARARNASRLAGTPTSDQQETQDPGLETASGAYDDPERRPLGERCLLGFGSTSGPPALPVLYNNLHEIVQTPSYVMILNEMDHDARIVRMNSEHLPSNIRRWMGDSVGRWEGETLVVDTTNFTDKTRFRGSSENLHVVERFSRIDAKTLLYRFTIEDSSTWTSAWTGEYVWPATDEHLYEYACHEANYALGDILRGARQREADQKKTR
jgi:hypothetical protein